MVKAVVPAPEPPPDRMPVLRRSGCHRHCATVTGVERAVDDERREVAAIVDAGGFGEAQLRAAVDLHRAGEPPNCFLQVLAVHGNRPGNDERGIVIRRRNRTAVTVGQTAGIIVTVASAATESDGPTKTLDPPSVNVVPLLKVIEPLPALAPVVRVNPPPPTSVPPLYSCAEEIVTCRCPFDQLHRIARLPRRRRCNSSSR